MKVLQINTVVSSGSTGRICRDIYDILLENDHECCIAYGRGLDAENYYTYQIGSKVDNYSHFFLSYAFNKHGYGSTISTKKFINFINDFKPDIIQLHNIHGYYLNFIELFNYLSNTDIPVFWLMHDQWAISGGPAYIIDSNLHVKSEYPRALIRNNYYKNLSDKAVSFLKVKDLTILTPSDWLNKEFQNTFLNRHKIITINNGVDLNKFYPSKIDKRQEFNIPTNKKIILGVADYWTKRKGIDFFLSLTNDFLEENQLVLIGVDKELEIKLSEKIIAIPRTQSLQELVDWYSTADLFVNPTLFDNFPTVNIESLACGTPVITFNSGGSGEAIVDGFNGKVIQRLDYSELFEQINRWPIKSIDIQNNCLQTSRDYSKDIVYKKYLDLYSKKSLK